MEDLNADLKLDEKFARALVSRGAIYKSQKKYDKALEDFNAAIKLNEKYANPLVLRGIMYDSQKKYDKAFDDFNAAIRLDEKYAEAFAWRGSLYQDNKGNLSAARDDYKRALELDPSLDWIRKRLAGLGAK